MNYYDEIKERLIESEVYDRVKDYSKDRHKVSVYFEIGKLLSEAGKEYGKNIIRDYSEKLMIEVGKKYNERTLYRMRKLYEVFSNEKLTPLVTKLSWTHNIQLLSLRNVDEIIYYINITLIHNYNKRQLQSIIKNHEYDRLSDETKKKLISKSELNVSDLIPNPIVIKANNLNKKISEYALKELILNDLDNFLCELGSGFTYVGNEYKIKIGDRYNYIDILLYNVDYSCYVVIELKVTELKKSHIGQLEIYMNYIDNNLRKFNQEKTIGIIICKKDNKFIIEYCSDKKIIAREYLFTN